MLARAQLAEPQPRQDASPGLLRRRYSVPETIMRKYRLAQQRSDSEESGAVAHQSAASACPSPAPPESPHRSLRRDRELMRKSALLRRMWTRPCRAPVCCCCAEEARETRSLDGSRSELRQLSSRRSPAPWASPKRQRLEAPDRAAPADLSDSTFRSHRGRNLSSYIDTMTDAFTDSEASRFGYASESHASPPSSERLSEPVTAEPDSEEHSPPDAEVRYERSFSESGSFSPSASTAKETNGSVNGPSRDPVSSNGHIEGRVSERSAGLENEDRNVLPYERPLAIDAPESFCDLLEVVVSETATADQRNKTAPVTKSPLTLEKYKHMNIDEYVSNILVESLNSLTDQLESMNASIGSDRKISIVEKEIKVKLQNTGVNTIVHLSPTSNNQIIFGNEELCNNSRCARDECNNPLLIREEREHSLESNNNFTSSAGTHLGTNEASFEPPLQHNNVNRAVLQQIQKLFREELRSLDDDLHTSDTMPGVSHIEISNVDVYIDNHSAAGETPRGQLEISTRADGDLIGGVGAGNYFYDGDDAVAVPRFTAYPHTESMEVNTSSSEDVEPICSDCTSLVDSLDDPNSPRGVLLRRRGDLACSAIDVLELLPEGTRGVSSEPRGEAYFIRIKDDDGNADEENVNVARFMPEKIKQRLNRRHRKRELRMECARRSKVKQLKKELERRRLEETERARRELERDCMAIVNALIDDVVAKVAQDEYKCMRIKHRNGRLATTKSEENLAKHNRRRDLEAFNDRNISKNMKKCSSRSISDKENLKSEKHQIRGKLLARPSLISSDRPSRRIYQKSEIHEGEKCIEILEILEYVNGSQSSPETTNSDENQNHSSKCKKSRIPIPVYERIQRTTKSDTQIRLTGGDGRRGSPPTDRVLASMLLQALSGEPGRAAPEPRDRSNSLRFKRVFDVIPEERSSLSFDSSAEDAELARRASAPPLPAPPAAARRLCSQTTMTSPCTKSAATSPLQPPAAPRPAREGGDREKLSEAERRTPTKAAAEGDEGPPVPPPRSKMESQQRRQEGCSSSDSGGSGGSLLCALAPRWLSAHARQRRRARRPAPPPAAVPPPPPPPTDRDTGVAGGGWSVTVAGSSRAALPADVEMRLRFPHDRSALSASNSQECRCVQCGRCAALPPAPAAPPAAPHDARLTLTMKKEAQDSSILASKSRRKSTEQLPELETYRASRTKVKSSVKTRRGYSLHCWLPDDEPTHIRANNGLSVLGCAIIPELKPRVPTMSERDLTRQYTPRHYLRS